MNSALKSEFESGLKRLSEEGLAVIVEGKNDKAALEKLGIAGSKIFVLSSQPLFEVAESVAETYKEAAILTDLDSEGRKLYDKLNTLLQRNGVRVDNRFRNFLYKNTKIRQIEGLSTLV